MAETTGAAVQIPSSSDSNEPIPITSQEEKELRRVFERMCDFSAKSKYKDNIHELKAKIAICRAGGREQDSEALTEEIARMRQKIKEVEAKEQKLISCQDVMEMLILLGENPTQEEVEKMVWEVDEDLDMKVHLSSFLSLSLCRDLCKCDYMMTDQPLLTKSDESF